MFTEKLRQGKPFPKMEYYFPPGYTFGGVSQKKADPEATMQKAEPPHNHPNDEMISTSSSPASSGDIYNQNTAIRELDSAWESDAEKAARTEKQQQGEPLRISQKVAGNANNDNLYRAGTSDLDNSWKSNEELREAQRNTTK